MLDNLLFLPILAIPPLILKFTNFRNWLITYQYLSFFVPKLKMYDCGYCLQFWLSVVFYLIFNYILFTAKS